MSNIWVVDLSLRLLSNYRYYLTMVLTIKEKVYINVKEEEQKEQRAGKNHSKKLVAFDHNSSG